MALAAETIRTPGGDFDMLIAEVLYSIIATGFVYRSSVGGGKSGLWVMSP